MENGFRRGSIMRIKHYNPTENWKKDFFFFSLFGNGWVSRFDRRLTSQHVFYTFVLIRSTFYCIQPGNIFKTLNSQEIEEISKCPKVVRY